MSVTAIAKAINQVSQSHPFGNFPTLRKELKGRQKVLNVIFDVSRASVNEEEAWAFHTGGREELQYNIAFERQEDRFRFGVAFSLEPSRSLPDVQLLRPKIERFNEFVRNNAASLGSYSMWIWTRDKLTTRDTVVRPISSAEAKVHNFIFLGKSVSTINIQMINVTNILDTFQELLPLYSFVEATAPTIDLSRLPTDLVQFSFVEGVTLGPTHSTKQASDILDITLRSNQIKARLCNLLLNTSGMKLGEEIASGNGGRIDLVVLLPSGEYDFYEIKPAVIAKHAIREAIPQLLEYAYRAGGQEPRRLVIVSQAPLDEDSGAFLALLRGKGLPLHYLHVPLPLPLP